VLLNLRQIGFLRFCGVGVILLSLAAPARADFDAQTTDHPAFIVAGIEGASLASAKVSVNGIGPHASLLYFLNRKFAVAGGLSLAVDASSGKLIYTSIDPSLQYSFFGTPLLSQTDLKWNGVERASVTNPSSSRLAASVALMQLFLNGVDTVYPSTGVGFGLVYDRFLFGHATELEFRYAKLSSNLQNLNGIILRLEWYFDISG
jgi:hypothetical protein